MIPALLKIQYAQFPFYQDMKTVYTIHNLQYQGVFPIKAVQDTLGAGRQPCSPRTSWNATAARTT